MKKEKIVSYMTQEQKDKIRSYAERNNVSMGELMLNLTITFIEHMEGLKNQE